MAEKVLRDQVFLKKLNRILEDNYTNEQFGVKELTQNIGISHSQIHRKLNALYQKSTSQYIREYRLQKAMKLLQNDIVTASEISYKVGFSSPTYFNTSFKEYYGFPPGEVKHKESIFSDKSEYIDKKKQAEANSSKSKILIISSIVIILIMALSYYFYTSSSNITIAVLPFKDYSPEDTQWFGDAIGETILTNLSQIKGLTVISRTSSDTYKGTDKKIPQIAKELGASYIIEGSVTKINNEVKIIIQLINANDERIWSEEYHQNFDDIFIIQNNVAKQIADRLKINLSPEEQQMLNTTPTDNLLAYELYLKARSFEEKGTKEYFELSVELYKEAIDLDPGFTDAYAELATVYILHANETNMYQYFDIAEELIDKAIMIDSNTAKAYSAKGMLNIRKKKPEESVKYFEKALELNPNDTDAHWGIAVYYNGRGNDEQKVNLFNSSPVKKEDLEFSLDHINKAAELDPFSVKVNRLKINILLRNGKLKEAEEFYKNKNKMFLFSDQNKIGIQNNFIINKARILSLEKKDWTEAIKYLHKEIEKDSNNAIIYTYLGYYYNRILNDDINFIKYTKKAFELDPKGTYNLKLYYIALVEGKKFEEAKILLNNIKDYNSKEMYLEGLRYLYFIEEDYDSALEIFSDSLMKDHWNSKAQVLARLGDIEGVQEILKNNMLPDNVKAQVFACLKQRDSMYYYLENEKNTIVIQFMNSLHEFDPYRKEERFKTILRKNYLPITHWNE